MEFGKFYNRLSTTPSPILSGWARTLSNAYLGFTLEVPYSNAGGCEVNARSASELGGDLAYSLQVWLKREGKGNEAIGEDKQ